MKRSIRPFRLTIVAMSWLAVVWCAATTTAAGAEAPPPLLDQSGRQLLPGGFVVLEDVPYTPADYQRMVRMGASFQVIRMPIGSIGGLPAGVADPDQLAAYDALVRMGRDAGLQTVFKLVVYGQPFGDAQWDALWNDRGGTQDALVAGWSRIWNRYRDEPSVFGYDLLNEPQRGFDRDYNRCQRAQLLPLLRRLADAMHRISPEKWALYQPLIRKREDQSQPGREPYVAIEEPLGRERVIYAPHLYQMEMTVVRAMLADFERQARLSDAPLLLGEWGSPTYAKTESSTAEQTRYTRVYQETVNLLDERGIGGIKAWFCGGRHLPLKGPNLWYTWAIFQDGSPAGRVERRYLTDGIARPRPLVVAGRLERAHNDFDTRRFEMILRTDPTLGATELYIPAARRYPEGFAVLLGSDLELAIEAGARIPRTVRAATDLDRSQADQVRWDDSAQHIIIKRWIGPTKLLSVRIKPAERL